MQIFSFTMASEVAQIIILKESAITQIRSVCLPESTATVIQKRHIFKLGDLWNLHFASGQLFRFNILSKLLNQKSIVFCHECFTCCF